MVYTILDSASVLKSSKLALVQEADQITVELPTATATGTNTYAATIDGIEVLTAGMVFGVLFTNANTGSSTLDINGLGAITLKKSVSTNLASGDIAAGQALIIYYDGTNFQVIGLGGAGSGSGDVVGPASATDSAVALFDGVTGKLLKDSAKTLSTDGTLTTNSDAKIPTEKAVKTYVDTSVVGLLELKGSTDCSANPNYPAASKGDAYYVTVAGKIGGASGKSVDVGDVYIASADNAGGNEASVGTSWFVLEANGAYQPLDATLTALAGLATGANKIPYSTGTDAFSQLDFKDEDDMASNSATAVPSQQSVKSYVDANAGASNVGSKLYLFNAY